MKEHPCQLSWFFVASFETQVLRHRGAINMIYSVCYPPEVYMKVLHWVQQSYLCCNFNNTSFS